MRVKYLYFTYFVALVGILFASFLMVARAAFERPSLTREPEGVRMPTLKSPEPALFEEIKRFEPILPSLVKPGSEKMVQVDLRAFGYRTVEQTRESKKGRSLHLDREFKHSVTFAFSGGRKGFCVIDGHFYPEGASLPGGGMILKVLPQKVLIEEGKLKRWIPVGAGAGMTEKEQNGSGEAK